MQSQHEFVFPKTLLWKLREALARLMRAPPGFPNSTGVQYNSREFLYTRPPTLAQTDIMQLLFKRFRLTVPPEYREA